MSNPTYLDYLIQPMTAVTMRTVSAVALAQDLVEAAATPVVEFGVQSAVVQAALADYVTKVNASQATYPQYVEVIVLQRTLAAITAYYSSSAMGFTVTTQPSLDLNPSFVRIRLAWMTP